jgi:hypothetical protein
MRLIPEYRARVLRVVLIAASLAAVGVITPQVYKSIVDTLAGVRCD